ncbi:MAG: hypothetical protein L3J45_02880 [Flavobacteriaceae bacterium]|nr:hypothetical protein [Flavobacteriaceae bacterium]
MHKKVEADLMALARTILALNKHTDIDLLKKNTQLIYDQLCVLEYLKLEKTPEKESCKTSDQIEPPIPKEETLFSIEDEIGVTPDLEDIFIKKEASEVPEIKIEAQVTPPPATLKEKIEAAKQEEKQALKSDLAVGEETSKETLNLQSKPKVSLNDSLQKGFSIDLNDRIALVKHLFEDSQEDFNRVLSQLNTFETEQAAKNFILNQVKPDYSWQKKETYEERFLWLIERNFTS